MATEITDEEWDTLASEGFDTTALLRAVDVVDRMCGYLGDGENGEPPDLRTDLLRLHQLAMDVFNQHARGRVAAMFETAVDLEDQVDELMTWLMELRETISRLTTLYPESLSYGDWSDVD